MLAEDKEKSSGIQDVCRAFLTQYAANRSLFGAMIPYGSPLLSAFFRYDNDLPRQIITGIEIRIHPQQPLMADAVFPSDAVERLPFLDPIEISICT